MSSDQPGPPPFVWQAAGLRITAFPIQHPDPTQWWMATVGEEPQSRLVRPKQATLQEEGDFERGRLRLIVAPNRIDWIFSVSANKDEEDQDPFESLGPLAHSSNVFSALIKKWLVVAPDIKRLAFGAILTATVESYGEVYRRLQPFLHHVQLDEASSDFFYQINRRRDSATGIPNLKINRLSKWSVLVKMESIVEAGGQVPTVTQLPGPPSYALRLELDINTAPEFPGPLPREALVGIYSELVGLAEEISERGDIP